MTPSHPSADPSRNPLLAVIACVFILILAALGSCVAEVHSGHPSTPRVEVPDR
jgi:hypothetical protein